MPVITVTYASDDGTRFDHDYYTGRHIPLVKQRWSGLGLTNVTILRGIPGPDGSQPAVRLMALLTFDTMERFLQAAKAHGKEIFDDVANFTDAKPTTQFNDEA